MVNVRESDTEAIGDALQQIRSVLLVGMHAEP